VFTTAAAQHRYRIVETIGKGGMGEVCLANDLMLDRRVALKFPASSRERDALDALLSEARAAAALDHPFICKIYEVTELGGRPCIVMEYVPGETIERRLRRGPFPLADALRLGDEIAEALEAAHRRRVVHHDLKPANVMVTEDQHIKVMDFGLATRLPSNPVDQDVTAIAGPDQGMLVGTPAYLAPEQIHGRLADRRSDIFSFGVLLYELLSGTHPFLRGSLDATFAAILAEAPAALHSHAPSIPVTVSAVVTQMLTKDPALRYQTFADVRLDLRRLAGELTAPAAHVRAPVAEPAANVGAAAFVGRVSERNDLVQSVNSAVAGHGTLIVLGGEHGVGKSRLAMEAMTAARRLGCHALLGRCSEEDGTPLLPYVEVLEEATRLIPAQVFRKAVGRSGPELARLVPELQRLFPDLPAPLELPPELRQRFLFTNVREFLTRCSHITPLVIVLDDFQWADEVTLRLTQHLAQHLATVPVLVIAVCRDVEFEPAKPKTGFRKLLERLGGRAQESSRRAHVIAQALDQLAGQRLARLIRLHPLPEPAVRGKLAALGNAEPPERLVRQFYAETEGNPYFIEELFQHLKEGGLLFDSRGQWRRDLDLDDNQIPAGVRVVADRRLRGVSEATRAILTRAAVIGRHFDLDLLESIADLDSASLMAGIREAEHAHLLLGPSGRLETRWRFAHPSICQTLTVTLPQATRQRLHLRLADAMVAGALKTNASDIAHHLYRAGPAADVARTARALAAAGDSAYAVYATVDAVRHYRRAIEVLGDAQGDESMRLGVQERLADLLALTGDGLGARGHYKALSDAHGAASNRVAEARIVRKAGTVHWHGGDRTQAIACYQRALVMLEGTAAHIEMAHLYQELGLAAFRSGDNQRAIDWAERALCSAETAQAESPSDADIRRTANAAIAHATNTIGVALARSGQIEAARERIEQSVAAARQHGLLDVACRGYANLGVLYGTVEPQRAIDVSLTGLELASKIGAASLQSYLYANLAAAYCALTERCDTEGLVAATAAANLDRELGQLDHLAVPLIVMGQIHQCHGRLEDAQRIYLEALALAEKAGEPQLLLPCYDGLATIHLDRGDRQLAEQYLERARDLCERTGIDPDTLLLLPFLC